MGNRYLTGYLILICIAINAVLIFIEKLLWRKKKTYTIGNITCTEGKKVGLGQELLGNIKNSNDIKNINL